MHEALLKQPRDQVMVGHLIHDS